MRAPSRAFPSTRRLVRHLTRRSARHDISHSTRHSTRRSVRAPASVRTALVALVTALLAGLVGPAGPAAVAAPLGQSVASAARTGQVAALAVGVPSRAVAGTDLPVTVRALDARGRVVRDYLGTVTLTSSGIAVGLPATYAFTARDRGVRTFRRVELRTAGPTTVAATDVARPALTGTSRTVDVAAGRTQRLAVTAPAQAVAGSPVDVTVTAQDRWGNTDPTYTGTVALRSTDAGDGAAVAPGTYRFTRADAGTVTFAAPRGVVLVTAGVQTIRVADTRDRRLGGSADVAVAPAPQPATGLTAVGWGMDLFGGLGDGGENEYATNEPRTVLGGAVWAQVAAGDFASAGIRDDGTLWIWGAIGRGGAFVEQGEPVQLGTDDDWASVDGEFALRTDGTLWTWQQPEPGTAQRDEPVQVGTDADWAAVAAGLGHAVALKTDGTLWGWGAFNHWGQQGNGTLEPVAEPRRIGTDADWAAVSVHVYQSVALKTDGTLWGWGLDPSDAVDPGSTLRTLPEQVGADTDWAAVDAGYTHTAALKRDGSLWSWGSNLLGALGDGTTTPSAVPVQEARGAVWTSVAAGDGVTLAVAADGTLWTWGNQELGAPSPETPHPVPEAVGSGTDWVSVTAGGQQHVFALRG